MKILTRRARRTVVVGAVGAALFVGPLALPVDAAGRGAFSRLSTFTVSANAGSGSAEIVAAADNGRTLLYTDAGAGLIGFVDVRDPSNPVAAGSVAVGGSPTSVAVQGRYALVLVDDTPVLADETFGPHTGRLVVVEVASRSIVRTVDLGGQPDSIKISPDGCWAVIAIENQRDENVAGGVMPHIPANGARLDEPGWVTIVDLKGAPARWTTKQVELVGLPGLKFPEDPEPEFVDINQHNQAAVTLQENNHVVIIDAPSATVVGHWSAGAVSSQVADTSETPSDIVFGGAISLPREPDAVSWVDDRRLVTSDEGDYEGGSRSFTLFDARGRVLQASGASLELEVVRHGHYDDARSENKGAEPEGGAFGTFGGTPFAFIGLERANAVAVYEAGRQLSFRQLLPTGVEPEGLLPIPKRSLFVAASEGDGTLSIFGYGRRGATYPAIVSADSGTSGAVPGSTSPIPWAALSALAADPKVPGLLFTVHDNVLANTRIYTLDARKKPAVITKAIDVRGGSNEDWDAEGLTIRPARAGGGFWLASEGSSAAGTPDGTRLNHLVAIDATGAVTREVPLPAIAGATPSSAGFEGVAAVWNAALGREEVYVAIQRSWDGTTWTRIGRYLPGDGTWAFVAYPLDAGSSVGLSELVSVGPDELAVIERDNQGGASAIVKRLYRFSIAGLAFIPIDNPSDPPLVVKSLVDDLLDDLAQPRGQTIEKVEGLAVDAAGATFVNTDNDGEDGESQLFRLGPWRALAAS